MRRWRVAEPALLERQDSSRENLWNASESELESLENAVVDCIEVLPTAFATCRSVEKVLKMAVVVEKVTNDKTLARQLRRKFRRGC